MFKTNEHKQQQQQTCPYKGQGKQILFLTEYQKGLGFQQIWTKAPEFNKIWKYKYMLVRNLQSKLLGVGLHVYNASTQEAVARG